jgi:hypothetical protein
MLDSDKSSYVEKKKQLNKNRHDKGTYFVISAAAAAAAEAVAFSAANKHGQRLHKLDSETEDMPDRTNNATLYQYSLTPQTVSN